MAYKLKKRSKKAKVRWEEGLSHTARATISKWIRMARNYFVHIIFVFSNIHNHNCLTRMGATSVGRPPCVSYPSPVSHILAEEFVGFSHYTVCVYRIWRHLTEFPSRISEKPLNSRNRLILSTVSFVLRILASNILLWI